MPEVKRITAGSRGRRRIRAVCTRGEQNVVRRARSPAPLPRRGRRSRSSVSSRGGDPLDALEPPSVDDEQPAAEVSSMCTSMSPRRPVFSGTSTRPARASPNQTPRYSGRLTASTRPGRPGEAEAARARLRHGSPLVEPAVRTVPLLEVTIGRSGCAGPRREDRPIGHSPCTRRSPREPSRIASSSRSASARPSRVSSRRIAVWVDASRSSRSPPAAAAR